MNINFGKKFIEYQLITKLAKEIKSQNPDKTILECRQEAETQLKAEGKFD